MVDAQNTKGHTAQLAQANLAWMRYAFHDARMAEMCAAIDRINRLGDESVGAVWRYQTTGGDATDVRVLEDPRILFNLTTWRSLDHLRLYVYRSEHVAFVRRRREWFIPPPKDPVVLWWVTAGTRPGVDEAMARFDRLWRQGPSAEAFTFKEAYDPDGRLVGTN